MSVGTSDPRLTMATRSMGWLQIVVVAISIGLTALDGFDVLSISFASPGISKEWGLANDGLGWVLSMELWGMALGSLLLGGLADKIGRRPTTIGCVIAMIAGMFLATTAHNPWQLSIWRVLTGLGIGGLLAAINAVTAEFSNTRRKGLCISLMAIGYPLGAVIGGKLVATGGPIAHLFGTDWRAVFYFGALITAFFLPLVLFLMPESVHWLVQKQPRNALEKVNRALTRMGHPNTDTLPVISTAQRQRSIGEIFAPAFIVTTLLLAATYFFHVVTFYFIIKWIPKLVTELGFTRPEASNVLVWANIGGATGGVAIGLLALRFAVKPLTILTMVMSTAAVALFGHMLSGTSPTQEYLTQLCLYAALAGFCTNAAIVGMYTIFAQAYPTHVRAFGTGFAIGIGRGGSALAPVIGGYLLTAGLGKSNVATIMGLSALVAAILLSFLRLQPEQKAEAQGASPSLTGAST